MLTVTLNNIVRFAVLRALRVARAMVGMMMGTGPVVSRVDHEDDMRGGL